MPAQPSRDLGAAFPVAAVSRVRAASEVDPAVLEVGYPLGVAFERPTPESEVVPYFVTQSSR